MFLYTCSTSQGYIFKWLMMYSTHFHLTLNSLFTRYKWKTTCILRLHDQSLSLVLLSFKHRKLSCIIAKWVCHNLHWFVVESRTRFYSYILIIWNHLPHGTPGSILYITCWSRLLNWYHHSLTGQGSIVTKTKNS